MIEKISFEKISKRYKFIISSILLILLGTSFSAFNSSAIIGLVITLILITRMFLKNKKENNDIDKNNDDVEKDEDNNNENNDNYNKNNDNKNDDNKNENNKNENNKNDDNKNDNNKNNDNKNKYNIKEFIKKNNNKSKQNFSLNDNHVYYNENPYQTEIKSFEQKYSLNEQNYDFELKINQSLSSTPIFHMRTLKDLDFYWNFVIHNFDNKKINNLIMCRDIHKWMDNSTLSNDDLDDDFCPIYYITKNNNSNNSNVIIFEYLKIFIHTDASGNKNAFIQKGLDYLKIEKFINELIDKEIIKDLLNESNYYNYNLSLHDGVTQFLDCLLSLILPPESVIGNSMILDIKNNCENKVAYEFMYNTLNIDSNTFNTTI
jgi:hypothetical protein